MPLDWTLISADTLIAMDFDALLRNVEERECAAFGEELSRLARDESRWSPEQHECLRFVGQVLTMTLRANQPNEPYGPMFAYGEQRSAIPADFPKERLVPLHDWASALHDPELRARLLDVLWIQARSFSAVLGAVDAYIESALLLEHPQEWPPCLERLERALRLAAGLGKGGVDLKERVLGEILAMVRRHRGTDPLYLSMRLTRLLLEFKHGDAKELATFASAVAASAEASNDFFRARDHYRLEAECLRMAGDTEAEGIALRNAAESLVKESELAKSQPGRGSIAAASILSDAVEAMRAVPGGKGRATELHERLLTLQQESMSELQSVSTSIDTTELIQRALEEVRGKPLNEAILALCSMAKPPSVAQLIRGVHDQARIAILGSLFSSEVVNSRGRVVARVPGLEAGANDPNQEGLRWRMFQNARLARSLTVRSMLNPAREEIFFDHGPARLDIAGLIRLSPWIPPGHAESVMRALMAGFQGDMLVAGHLVAPQLEAIVRHVVETLGGTTSMLQAGGVQPERPLAVLLETAEALRAFGADGVFELQGLLVDPLGTNLRNEVAHGLLDDSGFFGDDVLYAWWVLLRLMVLTSKIVEQRETMTETTKNAEQP